MILVFVATLSHALDQGSYYVIDLVEAVDSTPVAGRLAVPQTALDAESTEAATSLSLTERSEFEIDYGKGLQTTGNSTFQFTDQTDTTTDSDTTSFSTETFDFGSSTTVFGE